MIKALRVDRLSKRFGTIWAIRDVSLSVSEGEVMGFLGPNGAGKTTTIRVLLGLVKASTGGAQILGEAVPAGVETMSRVGSLQEEPRFYGWLSGRDNLRVLLQPLGFADRDTDQAIDRVGLADVARRKVKTYSHGMRTRLGLAQAICGAPRLLILDEPTTGLDPVWIRELRTIVRDLASGGAAVFLSSHQLTEVEHSCDRALILQRGRVVAKGSLGSILGSGGWYVVELRSQDIEEASRALRALTHERLPNGLRVKADSGRQVSELLSGVGILPEGVRSERTSLEDRFFEFVESDASHDTGPHSG